MQNHLNQWSLAFVVLLSSIGSSSAEIVSQWSFEGNLNDSASGGGVTDHLSYVRGSSPSAGPAFVPGVPGRGGLAASFDGNHFVAPDSSDLDITDTWTIEAFLSVSSPNFEWERMIVKWGASSGQDYHFGLRNGGLNLFASGGVEVVAANTPTPTNFADGEWHHVAISSSPTGSIGWIDGVQVHVGSGIQLAAGPAALGLGDFESGQGNNDGLRFHGRMDEVVIHNNSVDQAYIDGRVALLTANDSDSDGLLDFWEQQIVAAAAAEVPPVILTLADIKGPNDTPEVSDYDEDGASDASEFSNGTSPVNPDSDSDGLPDGAETNTGLWVNIKDTGTNPLNDDSDGDGLKDGVENPDLDYFDINQPGTDPNKLDSDDDGISDTAELSVGTDPSDPGSRPDSIVVSKWSFEDDLADSAVSGVSTDNLTDETDGLTYVPGVIGKAVAFKRTAGLTNKLTAADSPDLNLIGDWTMEAFVWRDADNTPGGEWERFWCKWQGATEYHWSFRGADFTSIPDGLDLFANDAQVFNHESTTTSIPFETWVHVALVGNSSESNTIRGFVNGIEVISTPYVAIPRTGAAMTFGNFGTGNQSDFQFSGYIDEAQIHLGAVSDEYLMSRAALLVTDFAPEIVEVAYVAGSDTATVTWTSGVGQTYALDWSDDLQTWTVIDDAISGLDVRTSYDDESIPLGERRRFYRVRLLP